MTSRNNYLTSLIILLTGAFYTSSIWELNAGYNPCHPLERFTMIQQRMEKAWDAFKVARDIRDAAQQASDKAFEVWSAMNDELENDDDDDNA